MKRRVIALTLAAIVVAGTGCVPRSSSDILPFFMRLLGGTPEPGAKAAKIAKRSATLDVNTTYTIGGLTGSYDITLGTYGTFSGTATIVGQKRAKLTDEGSDALKQAVHGMLLDGVGQDITVTEATAKFAGRQTTGGVHKYFKGKIKFKGVFASGDDAGKPARGKITSKGDLEAE